MSYLIIRFPTDLLHLLAMILLVNRIKKNESCTGVSMGTQILFSFAMIARYSDIFVTEYYTLYQTSFKTVYIIFSGAALYLMRKYRDSYDVKNDWLRLEFIVLPCFVMAILSRLHGTWYYTCWSFSMYVEATAILPQFYMAFRARNSVKTPVFVLNYVLMLAGYRLLYLIFLILRKIEDNHNMGAVNFISITSQMVLSFSCYFYMVYLYFKGPQDKENEVKLPIPADI